MRYTFWFFVITILVAGMVGTSGCAIQRKYYYASIGMTGPTVVARHGYQSVIFANHGKAPVMVTVSPTGDEFTVQPSKSAIVKLSEGLYQAQVSDPTTGKSLGRTRKFFVPAVGRTYNYDGSKYAAGMIISGRR